MLDWFKARKRGTGENWKEKGNAHLAQGRNEEALACYLKAIEDDARDSAAHLNAGFACQELARHADATEALKRALALDPGSIDAHYLLGKSLVAQDALEEAAASFAAAIALNPAFAFAHRDLGVVEERRGRIAEAVQSYERAMACEPDFAADLAGPLQVLRARVLHGAGNEEGALAVLDALLQADPQDVAALQARGNILFDLKRYEAALRDCEQAVALQPDLVEALSSCGAILERLGRYQEALEVLDRALVVRPGFAAAAYNQGVCLLELGRCRVRGRTEIQSVRSEPALEQSGRSSAARRIDPRVGRARMALGRRCVGPAIAAASFQMPDVDRHRTGGRQDDRDAQDEGSGLKRDAVW